MNREKLGERLKSTRIQKRLTQKEVAGDFITRNMLSQIENGLATPSIKTLEYLAKALDKPVAYFMETLVDEDMTTLGDNFSLMTEAYDLYDKHSYLECKEILDKLLANINSEDKPANFREIYSLAWKCYYILATNEFINKQYNNAIFLLLACNDFEKFTPYVDSFSKSNSLLMLTKICIMKQDFDNANMYYKQYDEIVSNINYEESIFVKCELLINAERYDECKSLLLNNCIHKIKSSYKYKYFLGILHIKCSEYDEAINDFSYVLDNYDDLSIQIKSNIYKYLADCYSAEKNFEEAYKYMGLSTADN